jgi:anaphase-promoting complex subunit 5
VSTPKDELWALQTAIDMGECIPTAYRRAHLASARYQQTRLRPEDKRDAKDGWTVAHEWDEAVLYACKAGLWATMGARARDC